MLWVASATKPEMMVAVCLLARVGGHPSEYRYGALKRCLRYCKKTRDRGLIFTYNSGVFPRDDQLTVWVDADWGGEIPGRKSCTGGILVLNGTPIDWISRKQATVALSSMEAEYMAASTVVSLTMLYGQVLEELGLSQNTISIIGDNTACISLARNDQTSKRAKHIDLRYHFIRELQQAKVVNFVWTKTENELADILTKPLPRIIFVSLLRKIESL